VVLALAAVGVAVAVIRCWRPFRIEIEGPSMRPVLEDGDWALAVSPAELRPGDVVVIEHPARPGFEIVKRIIAVGGERAPDGSELAPGEFWVEGDAAEASTDSRRFGSVGAGSVAGRVVLVWWPPRRWSRLVSRA
jgi:signal peptidase I